MAKSRTDQEHPRTRRHANASAPGANETGDARTRASTHSEKSKRGRRPRNLDTSRAYSGASAGTGEENRVLGHIERPDATAPEPAGTTGGDDAALADLLAAAERSPLAGTGPDSPGKTPANAPSPVLADPLPGMCMGVSVFVSLGLCKIGFDGLTEKEADALTAAIVRTLTAFEITIADSRTAAVIDLGGVFVAILVPRIMSDIVKRKNARQTSPTQAATQDREEQLSETASAS
jgi:hypothetical protein